MIKVAGPPRASTIAPVDDDTVECLDEKGKENRIEALRGGSAGLTRRSLQTILEQQRDCAVLVEEGPTFARLCRSPVVSERATWGVSERENAGAVKIKPVMMCSTHAHTASYAVLPEPLHSTSRGARREEPREKSRTLFLTSSHPATATRDLTCARRADCVAKPEYAVSEMDVCHGVRSAHSSREGSRSAEGRGVSE